MKARPGPRITAIAALVCLAAGFGVSCARRPGPPAGMPVRRAPQFVYFTSDDVGLSGLPGSGGEGGLHFLTELFGRHRNPPGAGLAATFDGSPLHFTLFVNTFYLDRTSPGGRVSGRASGENPVYTKRAWKEAVDADHEIALHTHSHPHGASFSVDEWRAEIRKNIAYLTRPWDPDERPEWPNAASGLGLARSDILGFRAPFIEYNDNMATAVALEGLAYDSSVEVPGQAGRGRVDYDWPFKLDRGWTQSGPPLGPHPGLWEIPIYDFIAPADEDCPRYGLAPGFRARLRSVRDYFLPSNGEITGMDWNPLQEFRVSADEFLAILEYSLDRHLEGNRCPMTVGLHTDLYSDKRPAGEGESSPAARREAIRRFLEYALSKPDVRIVSCRELLSWMKAPAALR
jgi:hypothetical protein